MNSLIPVSVSKIGDQTVNTVDARVLHEFLESKQQFSNWIQNQIEAFGFTQDVDYCVINNFSIDATAFGGKRKTVEYHLAFDMAKELSMVERSAKGKQARQYFIECERRAFDNTPSPYTALSSHTVRAVQVGHSKSVNTTLIEQGGRNAIVSYNLKNCTVQSGRLPAEWKAIGKADGLPARLRSSAKDVLRIKAPQVACGMSLADQLITGGATVDDGISIGKDSQHLFQRILALGITPPELLL